ncbi:MAG TPA: hypothetical protein VE338_12665 [Ktedonobacterales bacterium]|jgi:hypothetical protein|nr:hypothetical protein [Ktedonobacterales bacterium]
MKTISLWQPWASLMATGYKRIETRSWSPFKLCQGELVAIHAAKRWTADERDICADEPFKRCLTLAAERGLWDFDQPALGCVVAIARFQMVIPTLGGFDYDRMSDDEYAFGNYAPGRYGWVFSQVRPLRPIPARGMQGIFDWQVPADLCYVEAKSSRRQPPMRWTYASK